MTKLFTRTFVACAFAAAIAAPAFAANDSPASPSSGLVSAARRRRSPRARWPSGAEIQCAGNKVGTGLCTSFVDGASIDLGADTLSLSIDPAAPVGRISDFNGYEFSGLSAGGEWSGYSLATDFAGLDTSRITFARDALRVNMTGIRPWPASRSRSR